MIGNIRRNTVVFIAVCLTILLLITGCRSTSSTDRQEIVVQIESMDSFTKLGNIKLKIRTREFMETFGFEYGDAVRVRFLDKDMVLPLVSTFSLLDVGETGICAEETNQSGQSKEILLFTNLADSQTVAEKTKGFSDTYYSKTSILFNEMGVDYRQESFKNGLKMGFKYIADNEGVYYVHCSLGKDRTGIFCAVLEALMGASAEQVIEDYMKTYVLYYGLQKGSLYDKIADTNICNALEELLALDSEFRDVTTEHLTQAAYGFIRSIGLSDSEIASLKTNLSRVRTV